MCMLIYTYIYIYIIYSIWLWASQDLRPGEPHIMTLFTLRNCSMTIQIIRRHPGLTHERRLYEPPKYSNMFLSFETTYTNSDVLCVCVCVWGQPLFRRAFITRPIFSNSSHLLQAGAHGILDPPCATKLRSWMGYQG